MGKLEKINNIIFENIKQTDDFGEEFWHARELYSILNYSRWENIIKVINKARLSCERSSVDALLHFREITKIVIAGATSKKLLILNYLDMLVV